MNKFAEIKEIQKLGNFGGEMSQCFIFQNELKGELQKLRLLDVDPGHSRTDYLTDGVFYLAENSLVLLLSECLLLGALLYSMIMIVLIVPQDLGFIGILGYSHHNSQRQVHSLYRLTSPRRITSGQQSCHNSNPPPISACF